MKRFFICAAAAIVALASCSKTEVVNTSAPEEIGFKAVTGVMTKGVQTTNDFDQTIGVLAYNTTDLTEYFANAKFTKTTVEVATTDDSGAESTEKVTTWNGEAAKYWPIDSKLDFVVYSPYQETGNPVTVAVTNTSESKTLTVTVADNTKTSLDLQTDYMYGAEYYTGHDKNEASVAVNFKHALSLITVNFTGNENVTIVAAVLDDTAQEGSYTVQYFPAVQEGASEITWTSESADNDLTLNPATETKLSTEAITTEYMVVPTAASSITITYKIEGMTGANLVKTIDLTETWAAGTHYTYNVNIGAHEIKFSTIVTDWSTGDTTGTNTSIE